MGKYVYSLAYNGGYMLPELGITLALAVLLLESRAIRRLCRLPEDTPKAKADKDENRTA